MLTAADVEARLAEIRDRSLRELFRRAALELGVIDPPAGTRRVERVVTLDLTPGSMNENALRSHWKGFHPAKKELQGHLMRVLDALEDALPRPIPAVEHPVWTHVVLRFPTRRERDAADNFYYLIAKALGDALTGLPASDRKVRVNHRTYTGWWLIEDTAAHRIFTLDIDEDLGPHRTTIRLVWDELIAA